MSNVIATWTVKITLRAGDPDLPPADAPSNKDLVNMIETAIAHELDLLLEHELNVTAERTDK